MKKRKSNLAAIIFESIVLSISPLFFLSHYAAAPCKSKSQFIKQPK